MDLLWTSCELDVLGLQRNQTALLDEAKWTVAPLGHRQIEKLRGELAYVPDPVENPWLALWSRAGLDPAARAPKILGYSVADRRDALSLLRRSWPLALQKHTATG